MHPASIRPLALATLALASTAFAGTEPTSTPASVSAPQKSIFSGDLGITVANQYNTRGIIVQDQDFTFQPYLNLYAKFYEGQGVVQSASVFLGLWADVSTNGDVSNNGNGSRFTEFDYGLGLTVNFAERWNFTTFYNQWTSPANGYGDGAWVNGTLSFSDAGLISDNFAFKPYITILRDLGGDQPTGLKKNTWNFEPGIRPTYTLFADTDQPLNIGVTAKAGLGDEFYGGETFGYFAVGPQISLPLNFIDASAGKWSASLGYLYYTFGNTLEVVNGRDDEHLYSFNLSVSF